VDLVEALVGVRAHETPRALSGPLKLADYCGYFTLEEALEAREELRRESIKSEVVIREPAEADPVEPGPDEYWLRVDVQQWAAAERLLGLGGAETEAAPAKASGDDFACGACGEQVPEDARSCPKCGVEFDED
jgi:hypothetical protein